MKLVDAGGAIASIPRIALGDAVSISSPGEAAAVLRLPFEQVAPGKYHLIIELAGSDSDRSAILETDIELI